MGSNCTSLYLSECLRQRQLFALNIIHWGIESIPNFSLNYSSSHCYMSPPIDLSKWRKTVIVNSIKWISFVRQVLEVHEFKNTEIYGKNSEACILRLNSLSVLFWSHIICLHSVVALFWVNAYANTTIADCNMFQPTSLFCIQQSRRSLSKMEDDIVYSHSDGAIIRHIFQKILYGGNYTCWWQRWEHQFL